MNPPPSWPPDYHLKRSRRSHYVKLKTSMKNGLELIVPMRFNERHIPHILETNKEWIQKQLTKIHKELKTIREADLPEEISFPIARQKWKVQYVQSNNKHLQVIARPQKELVLLGNVANKKAVYKLLLAWVKQQSQLHLPKLLDELSEETGLKYHRISIRSQRTRWGSCTYRKIINVNFKLVLLPNHLVRHILIHELCHTRYMNHAPRFWRLVASFDKDWEQYSRETRVADQLLPLWIVNLF